MSALDGLTVAVPRGSLFGDTLSLLDELGVDTSEVRSNDRKLLFEDVGIITMRPSDVPTYVEAGAADIGITGKDVLLEQAAQGPGEDGREVYELLDLRYGRCTMVLATKGGPGPGPGGGPGPGPGGGPGPGPGGGPGPGPGGGGGGDDNDDYDPSAEALRRLGVVRLATKYPRIAARHMDATGRQAEIVEVKGSVELAPLTGMVEAIVDLTATGTTLREHGLVVREEIVQCTARLIANPVSHKLRAPAIDRLMERLRRAA